MFESGLSIDLIWIYPGVPKRLYRSRIYVSVQGGATPNYQPRSLSLHFSRINVRTRLRRVAGLM